MEAAQETTQMVPEVNQQEVLGKRIASIQERAVVLLDPATKQVKRIADYATANFAGELVSDIGVVRKEIAAFFNPNIAKADDLHKSLIKDKCRFDDPMAALEGGFKKEIGAFSLEESRRREAERLQREAEAKKQHESLVIEVAAEVEKSDGTAAAEEILKEADNVPPVVMEKQVIAGISITPKWKAEITDLRAYVEAIAAKKIPLVGVINIEEIKDKPNVYYNSFLTKQAASLKAEMAYPGVRVYEDRQVGKR